MTDLLSRIDETVALLRDHENEGVTSSDRYHIREEAAALLTELRAEVERLRGDGERLDWLEKHRATVYAQGDPESGLGRLLHWVIVDETQRSRHGKLGPNLRAAIDAASEQGKGER